MDLPFQVRQGRQHVTALHQKTLDLEKNICENVEKLGEVRTKIDALQSAIAGEENEILKISENTLGQPRNERNIKIIERHNVELDGLGEKERNIQ